MTQNNRTAASIGISMEDADAIVFDAQMDDLVDDYEFHPRIGHIYWLDEHSAEGLVAIIVWDSGNTIVTREQMDKVLAEAYPTQPKTGKFLLG